MPDRYLMSIDISIQPFSIFRVYFLIVDIYPSCSSEVKRWFVHEIVYQLNDVFLFAPPQKTVDQLLGARGVGRGMFGGWAGPKLRSHLAKLIWKGVIAAMGPLGGLPWTSAIFIGEYWINNSPINIHQYWLYLYPLAYVHQDAQFWPPSYGNVSSTPWRHGHGPRWCPSVDAWCAGVPWPKCCNGLWCHSFQIGDLWGSKLQRFTRVSPGCLWLLGELLTFSPIPLTGGSMGWRWDSGFNTPYRWADGWIDR